MITERIWNDVALLLFDV